MSIIEIVLLVLAVLGGLLAYQAHKNGLSLTAQYNADIATAKADATAAAHALELRVVALETKVGLIKPAAAPAPAPVATPTAKTASTPPAEIS